MDATIKTRVKLNSNGIVELTETALIEKYKFEEKVLKPKPAGEENKDKKDGEKEEDEYEIKIKDKTRTTTLNADVITINELTAA